MKEYHRLQMAVIWGILVAAFAGSVTLYLLGYRQLMLGLMLGGLGAAFNFWRLASFQLRFWERRRGKQAPNFLPGYLRRYLLSAVIMLLMLEYGLEAFAGAAVGLLLPKPVIILLKLKG